MNQTVRPGVVVEQATAKALAGAQSREAASCLVGKMVQPGSDATSSRDGDHLITEPVSKKGLAALLDSWEPLDEQFPEINDPSAAAQDIL